MNIPALNAGNMTLIFFLLQIIKWKKDISICTYYIFEQKNLPKEVAWCMLDTRIESMPSVKFRAAMSDYWSVCSPLYIDFWSDSIDSHADFYE